jgi:hypothetical protein
VEFLEFLGSFQSSWEARFIMLLWISLIVMTPFDLSTVDSVGGLFDRILSLAQHYSTHVGQESYAASILITRLFSRKDVPPSRMHDYIEHGFASIQSNSLKIFQLKGHLTCLCSIVKHGRREALLHYSTMIPNLIALLENQIFQDHPLMRKYLLKIIQRLALTFLKPRIASWRYQRGFRSLEDNLSNIKPIKITHVEDDNLPQDYEISQDIEDAVDVLLNGLSDSDTAVRWTAAKGIGRIADRLSFEFADAIVEQLMGIVQQDAILDDCGAIDCDISLCSDGSWQGCMLTLAELIRRGLLLPNRFAQAIPWVVRALKFEQLHGTRAVGANVRDAACYVCWSFARAFEPDILEPFCKPISQNLLVVSVFDREINVRRAASAAFQENVGRHVQSSKLGVV